MKCVNNECPFGNYVTGNPCADSKLCNYFIQGDGVSDSSQVDGSVSEVNEADYWKTRCELAEAFIESHVADPDLTDKMCRTYFAWCDFKKQND